MSWIARAALAAALLNCGHSFALAGESPANQPESNQSGQWLKDGDCSLFSAGAGAGDSVKWSGACDGGYASGIGTATFTHNGESQSFTAVFDHGSIIDGHVITSWGQGWSFDGDTVNGRFDGGGVLTTAAADRFEGLWVDGKMNGFGILRRANGDRYAGDWKDDKPNGSGELRHADGTLVAGNFIDGKLTQVADAAPRPALVKAAVTNSDAARAPFSTVSGKSLTGVDGSSTTLTLIEGGMELQVMPSETGNASARKTTFTFMTDRMGTVVEDTGAPSAGSSVTGFFRLTPKGVEVRYADGRSAMLSANGDGGVQMTLDGDTGSACRSWYPSGHVFSESEKKAALNAYAGKLGLPVAASDTGCGVAASAAPASAPATAVAPTPTVKARATRIEIRPSASHIAKASYHVGDYAKSVETVSVKTSEVHAIDGDAPVIPSTKEAVAMVTPATAPRSGDANDASHCLKVDSDGSHWGFRNGCDFAVQFAYCMAGGDDNLTACGKDVTTSVAGSVAAQSFGALMTDASIKEKDASHNFRWVACAGGAGEVVAHLDHSEPPAGRCERARTASN
jgi:hypothetical protein